MQLFKISFTLGDFKRGIYLFNRSTQINFGNASLLPGFVHNIFVLNSLEVVSNDEDQFLKISVHFQLSYLQNEVGDPYLFLHF